MTFICCHQSEKARVRGMRRAGLLLCGLIGSSSGGLHFHSCELLSLQSWESLDKYNVSYEAFFVWEWELDTGSSHQSWGDWWEQLLGVDSLRSQQPNLASNWTPPHHQGFQLSNCLSQIASDIVPFNMFKGKRKKNTFFLGQSPKQWVGGGSKS